MPRNVGKIFEDEIKNSIPDYVLLCRLPDAAQSFARNEKLRFSRRNPFDFIMWDSEHKRLFAIEAKTVAGKSISFERNEKESGVIHYYQVCGLEMWNRFSGIEAGFIIQFRSLEETIFLRIDDYNKMIKQTTKKSFRLDELKQNEIHFFNITQKKKRTRYTYDLDDLFHQIENEGRK